MQLYPSICITTTTMPAKITRQFVKTLQAARRTRNTIGKTRARTARARLAARTAYVHPGSIVHLTPDDDTDDDEPDATGV